MIKPWKRLSEKKVFSAEPWFYVSVETVRLPDGRVINDYYRLNLPEYCTIVAFTPDWRLVMIRQYRQGPRSVGVALPGGIVDAGERASVAAKRELREETGYSATKWKSLGRYTPHSNYGCGKANFFLATGARITHKPASGDLEDQEVQLVEPSEVLQMLGGRHITSLSTAAAFVLAVEELGGRAALLARRRACSRFVVPADS